MAVRMTGSPISSPVTSGPSASTTPVPSTPRRACGRGTGAGEAPERIIWSTGLTDLGRTLVEAIEVLHNWARDYGGAIADSQEAAEAATSARARAEGRP